MDYTANDHMSGDWGDGRRGGKNRGVSLIRVLELKAWNIRTKAS